MPSHRGEMWLMLGRGDVVAWWGPPESAVVQCCVGCLMLRWRLCASRPTFLMCRRVGPRAMCFASAANQWMPSFFYRTASSRGADHHQLRSSVTLASAQCPRQGPVFAPQNVDLCSEPVSLCSAGRHSPSLRHPASRRRRRTIRRRLLCEPTQYRLHRI